MEKNKVITVIHDSVSLLEILDSIFFTVNVLKKIE